MSKVVVIGAGVVGLCVASELMQRGCDVSVIDREKQTGPHNCSWWAGGMLAPWCEGESTEEIVVRLGQEALPWWRNQGADVIQAGTLVIANRRDQAELTRFSRRTSELEIINNQKIAMLEPELGEYFQKGLYFEKEAHLSPRDALAHLRGKLTANGTIFDVVNIPSVEALAAENPEILYIDCRGLAATDRLKGLRGVKGEMLLVSCPDVTLSRPIRLLHPRIPFYIVPRENHVFMLGATMIENNERSRISARSMIELLNSAYAVNPAFGEAEVLEIGVDARPAFSDNLPRIQRENNLISVNGLYRHGFLLSPAVARMVAEHILENKKPEVMHENFA